MRKTICRIFLLCAAFATVCLAQTAARRPNVLLIITDDQGYGDLGLHGNEQIRTPHLDRLGRESIRFDRFFVSPLCAPTRASLLTGRYSLRTGAKGVAQGLETMREEEVTIAEALRAAGYRTGLFGKWHNGEHYPYTPNGQGFMEAFGFNLGHWNNYFDPMLERNGRPVKAKGFITDALTDAALNFINANRRQPFFCYLAYNAPHSPFQVPDRYFDYYKSKGLDDTLASVYGMVENVDENIGRMLQRLDELKLRENTIVIFLTDNGPNGGRFNGGMRGVKGSLHEGGSRAPFFLRWPARFKEARLVKPIAAHIDLFPTLIELCGLPMPKTLPQDGRSLVPLLAGKEKDWPDRTLFTQHLLPNNPDRVTGAVRTEQYRLVNDGRGWELFEMQSDPAQQRNLAAERPEEAKRLTEAFESWWREILPQTGHQGMARPAIPIGYAEENPVELPVPQALFTGGLRFSGRHPNNGWLTGWTNVEAAIEWELDVTRAGRYAVSLQYLCPKADAGARVQINVAGSATTTTVRATTGRQIDSPDRVPRTEVYEMDWATLPAGALTLPPGRTKLTVRALTKPGEAVMDLKSVALKRINQAVHKPASAQTRKPNIVFVLMDDMGYADLGCYGARDIRTPNIDRLAREGVRFTDFYSNAPVCTPTRAAFITGRWQQRVGFEWAMGFAGEQFRRVGEEWVKESDIHALGLPATTPTLPKMLKAAGYATGAFGKWHLGYRDEFNPTRHGFDEYFGELLGHADYYNHSYYDGVYALRDGLKPVKAEGYLTDLLNHRAVEFVRQHAREPFFLYVPHLAVHAPFQPPNRPLPAVTKENMYDGDRRIYAAMLEKADEGVGMLLAELEKHGLLDNTLFVLSSDNGGERYSNNSPLFNHKTTLWEGGIRVPAVMRWPAKLPAGKVVRQPAITMDLTATFAAVAGAKAPDTHPFDGVNLLPILTGAQAEQTRTFCWRINRTDRKQKAVRHGRWKYVQEGAVEMLFDLSNDIGERRDLFFQQRTVFDELKRRLAAWEEEMAREKPGFIVR